MTLQQFRDFFVYKNDEGIDEMEREPIIVCNDTHQRDTVLMHLNTLGYELSSNSAEYISRIYESVNPEYCCPAIDETRLVCNYKFDAAIHRNRKITYHDFMEMIDGLSSDGFEEPSSEDLMNLFT